MNWFDDWALTLAVFVPAVGMAIVLLIPKAEENRDQGRRARSPRCVTLAVGIGILADFDYDHAGRLQFTVNEPWIDVINSRYHLGHRRHLAAAAAPLDVHHGPVRHLLLEPLPRAAQPEGVPRADPAARGRA